MTGCEDMCLRRIKNVVSDVTPRKPPLPIGVPRAVQHPTGREVGALEASRDMETGQDTSRAAPIPGPMVEQGTRFFRSFVPAYLTTITTADLGTRAAMVGQGSPVAKAG